QARGDEVDRRTDVFGLGALLYFVLAGSPPFPSGLRDRPMPPLDPHALGVPPELCAIAAKAMAADRGARYPDAHALGADLRRYQAGLLVEAHRYSAGAIARRFVRRNRAWLTVAATAFVALAALGLVSARRMVGDRERESSERAAAEGLAQFALDDLQERL